jgi:hypothetical protein
MVGGVLILVAPLWAQQTQVLAENDQIKVEVTKYLEPCAALFTGKGNSTPQDVNPTCTELAITNKSREPITAWVAVTETDVPGARHNPTAMGVRSSDSVAVAEDNRNNPQILARDTHRVGIGNPTRVDFKAAVFSDGSVFGDPEWVKRIIENRRQVYQATAIALQKLRAAQEAGTKREQLVREFRDLERRERGQETQSRGALAGPARLILSRLGVYGTVAANLERGQTESNADTLSHDIDRLESMMLDIGNRLLVSRPPISDHPVPLGEPLDSPPSPGHSSNHSPSGGIG